MSVELTLPRHFIRSQPPSHHKSNKVHFYQSFNLKSQIQKDTVEIPNPNFTNTKVDVATPLYTQPPQQQQSTFILELQLENTNTKSYSRNTKSKFHKYKSWLCHAILYATSHQATTTATKHIYIRAATWNHKYKKIQ